MAVDGLNVWMIRGCTCITVTVISQAKLQTAAAHVAALGRTLEAARRRWAAHFEGSGISEHVVTAAAAAALAANAEV